MRKYLTFSACICSNCNKKKKTFLSQVKYKKHKKANKTTGSPGSLSVLGIGNVSGVNGSSLLSVNKHIAGGNMHHNQQHSQNQSPQQQQQNQQHQHQQQQHQQQQQHNQQMTSGFLHHHHNKNASQNDTMNTQPTPSHPAVHPGHLVNGTILKTALTNPSEVSSESYRTFFLKIITGWMGIKFEKKNFVQQIDVFLKSRL